jgi:hypothetical protein
VPEIDDAWADQVVVSPAHLPAAVDTNGRSFELGGEVVVANFAHDAGRYAELELEGRGGAIVDLRPAGHPTSAFVEFEEAFGLPPAVHLVALDDLVVCWSRKDGKCSKKFGRRRE